MNPRPNPPKPPASYRAMHAVMSPILKRFDLSCRAAYELTAARMDRELTAAEARRLRLHLLMCGLCRRLPGQFAGLRECVRHACGHDPESAEHRDAALPEASKRRIADRVRDTSADS